MGDRDCLVTCACRKFLVQGIACLNVEQLRKHAMQIAMDPATVQSLVVLQKQLIADSKSKMTAAILGSVAKSGESSSGSESGEISSGDESRYVTSHNFTQL